MKLWRKLVISLFLMLLVPCLVWARPVKKAEAEKAVKGWLKTDSKPLNARLGGQIEATEVFNDSDGTPAYYIVYLNQSGFVIVSADDSVEPVAGFVAGSAIYDPSPHNPLGALVSCDIPERIKAARKIQEKLDAKVQKKNFTIEESSLENEVVKARDKWRKFQIYADSGVVTTGLTGMSDIRVAPLLQSKWGQDAVCNTYCYNYYTPNHYYDGCVATMMAQFMRFHRWPATGIGIQLCEISVDGRAQMVNTRGGDGNGGPYYWDRMVLAPDCSITTEQRQAIGALCYDAGIAAEMDYSPTSSGTFMHDEKVAMLNIFLYANAILGGNEGGAIGTGLNAMVNPNLDAGLPVQLGIVGDAGGHAVVVDGYGYSNSTLYHHLNMGWNGLDNAWYNLPNVDAKYDFTSVTACIYNIYTSGNGEIISGQVTYDSGQPFPGAMVTATGPGGPYSTTTNDKGIYALAKVHSASSYTISVTASGCSFTSKIVKTDTSTDNMITAGNKWGIDFTTNCSPPSPPAAPAAINYPTGNSTGQYTVSWSSSSGSISYQLDRSDDGGSKWTQIYSGANTSYTENISNGNFRYRVKATGYGGSSNWTTGTSNCAVSIPLPPAPPAPAAINYPTNSDSGQYAVSWSSSNDSIFYQLERSNDGGSSWTQIYSDANTSCAENVAEGSYRYRVKATNGGGSSNWTTGAWDCVVFTPPPPQPPASISYPASSSTGKYTVNWASSSGASSYQLQRSNNSGGGWSQIYSGSSTACSENVSNGSYRYRVKATNISGTSGWTEGTSDCVVSIPQIMPLTFQFVAGTSSGWDFGELDGDIVRNQTVDMNDLNVIAQRWLDSNCALINNWCNGADIDNSNYVDFLDYAALAKDWSKHTGENVLLQTIYGTAQNSGGTITANAYRAVQKDKGLAMAFNISATTALDKGIFKCFGSSSGVWRAGEKLHIRLFSVNGKGYLNYNHTMTKGDPSTGSNTLAEGVVITPNPAPYHSELGDGRQYCDIVVNFGLLQVTAGDYLITFDVDSSSPSNTWGSMVRSGSSTVSDGMGKYPDGNPLPKSATVTTTSSATGNTYYYQLDATSSTSYTAYSDLFSFHILTKNN